MALCKNSKKDKLLRNIPEDNLQTKLEAIPRAIPEQSPQETTNRARCGISQ